MEVELYSQCQVIPEYSEVYRPDNDGEILLGEVGGGGPLLHPNSKPIELHFPGNTLYGGVYHPIWGHFLVNTMARIWYYFSPDREHIDRIVFVSDNRSVDNLAGGNFRQFVELAGLSDRIEIVNRPATFEKLIVPDQALSHLTYSKEFMRVFDIVKSKALEGYTKEDYPDKIFLTRSRLKNSHANEINCEILDQFFSDNGFVVLSPEKMTLIELIRHFHSADRIASICGTLAHNFLFAPSTSEFIIVERHGFINEWQMTCNLSIGIDPTLVDAHYQPMQSDSIGFLFLYQATKELESWIMDNNLVSHKFPTSKKSHAKEFRRYLKRYKSSYGYAPYYHSYDQKLGEVYVEAILDTSKVYGPWMYGTAPVLFTDYFSLKCHPRFKSALRKLIRSLIKR